MGRFLLLIIVVASAVTASTLLRNTTSRLESQRTQSETHDLALAREAADAAHTAVLTALLRGGQLNDDLPLNETFEIDGRTVRIESFESRDDTMSFVVAGINGSSTHRISSRYLVNDVDFPGPLWVDAPYATANVNPKAELEGVDENKGMRGLYLDYRKLYDYRLDNLLDANTLTTSFRDSLGLAKGDRAGVFPQNGMESVLERFDTPNLVELYGDILAAFANQDVILNGPTKLAVDTKYGKRGSSSLRDTRLVRVDGMLGIPSGVKLEGNGVLLVEGNLVVEGELKWDGIVYVRSFEQELGVDFSVGKVEIRGTLIVEQEAPPPGGHMDLTIFRDLTGQWTEPSGEVAMASNGFTRHTHRSERVMPDRRVVLLDRRDGNPHEAYTRLEQTLSSISPNTQVFFEFDNVDVGGMSNYSLIAEDTLRLGSVNGGFGGFAESPVLTRRSRSFEARDLDQLVIDVRSLRLLQHHFDDERTDDPEANCSWNGYPWNAGCIPLNWPLNVKWLYNRGGAFNVKLYEETVVSDKLLYEAVFYWHRRGAWDVSERDAEVAADQQWRTDIQNGMGYGTSLDFGEDVKIEFDQERLRPAMRRLGYSEDNIRHLASAAENTSVREQAGLDEVVVCHNGRSTQVPPGPALQQHLAHGDPIGVCPDREIPGNGTPGGGNSGGGDNSGGNGGQSWWDWMWSWWNRG